ncbi:MAG TPA: sarcosine oxidase subunit delta [Bryobacteraceae bacterium]|nr:sarcosine oxidase subunit delta [Bryobacteraceae bacterium]
MSFLIPCPNCGERSVYEFRFGGEIQQRPRPDASEAEWLDFRYHRANVNGVQTEWWFHRSGCGEWLQAVRDTVSNQVLRAFLPGRPSL